MADQLDTVTQPLHRRARDEDTALHRVGDLAIKAIADRGQQTVLRTHRLIASVLDHETASTVGALDHARLEAGLADQGRLLVTGHAQHRNAGAEQHAVGVTELGGTIEHLGQQAGRDLEQLEQLFVPLLGMDVEHQRARGVAGVGAVHLAIGQTPQQEAVDGTEAQLTALGPLTSARHVMQNPAQLGGGEIRIDQQAGLGRDLRLVALLLESGAIVGGTPILPDDSRMDRRTTDGIPHQGGFALVGDADGGNRLRLQAAAGDGIAANLERGGPYLLTVVLDPAILREVLLELLLGTCNRQALGTEDDGAGAGGALVDG